MTVSKSMFPLQNSIKNITTLKGRFEVLQTQLATGQKAATLAEMGSDRYFDLAIRSRMSRIDGYQANIKTVNLRLSVIDTVVSRLDVIEADARAASVSGGSGSTNLNFETTPTLAQSRLDEVLTLMNSDLAGRYLFGGSRTETKPVADPLAILNGEGGRAGFKTVAGERRLADLGADQLGRLAIGGGGATVTLSEDGVHPFGFKLSTLSASTASITLGAPAGSPSSLSVGFGATLPAAGDQVTIGLTMPDGTEEQLVLTATTSSEPQLGEFQLGADANATAANFSAALGDALENLALTGLAAASAFKAADDFFAGTGETAMRVDGPPFETATAMVAGTAGNTVQWYTGEDSADPRTTVSAKVGEGTTVRYGVQANESGITDLVRALAAMAVQTYSATDETAGQRFDAMVRRNTDRLAEGNDDRPGSIEVIAVELGLAKTTAGAVGERHTAHKAQLGNMLDAIESIPSEEVAMEILAVKTRLEASYQTASLVSQLSLVNYFR
jgi:flagellar hook-associated protein 3 FlgL